MPRTELQNPQLNKLVSDAVDTASLAGIYHEQGKALFNAIQVLAENRIHTETIKQLCAIGSLLTDEAANAADCSLEAFEAVQS